MRKLKLLFHVVGLSCSAGLALTVFYVLFKILTEGAFFGIEPRLPVLLGEVGIALFGLSYIVYRILNFGAKGGEVE